MKHAREDYNRRIACTDGSIPDEEPVFLLRAQDRTAVATVRFWIDQQRALPDCDHRSVILAERHVERMEKWEPQKTADAPVQDKDDPFFDHSCTC